MAAAGYNFCDRISDEIQPDRVELHFFHPPGIIPA